MRFAFAGFLLLHGLAHLVGFLNPFGLVPARLPDHPPPPAPDVLFNGRVVLREATARALGVAWLALAIAFALVAMGVAADAPWWPPGLAVAVVASLLLTAAWWPASRIGFWIDVVLLALLAMTLVLGGLPATSGA
jgi:hypothetical protein